MKDVRGVAGTRSDGGTDEGHFYSLPPPMSGDKKTLSYNQKNTVGLNK